MKECVKRMNISNNLRIKLEKVLKKVGKQVSENEKKAIYNYNEQLNLNL